MESHRQEKNLVLDSLFTADGGVLKHEVSVNPDTGYLMVTAPDGGVIRVNEIGPFRVNCMLYA